MENMVFDRNSIAGFAQRIRINSRYLADEFEAGKPVHIVTQFMVSLLGLIVFPYATLTSKRMFPHKTMAQLDAEGWPTFELIKGVPFLTLEDLIGHLRHAISHYHVDFDPPNERRLAEIDIIFGLATSNRKGDRTTRINGAQLSIFIDRFSMLIKNLVD